MTDKLPVLHGPWSHSRATACPLALYKEKVLRAPPEPRPERLIAIDRRAYGSCLHEGADTQLDAVQVGAGWPDAQSLAQALLANEDYAHLAPEVAEIERRMRMYAQAFRMERGMEVEERDAILRERMLGHEFRLAVDDDGRVYNFDDAPPHAWRGIVDYAEDMGEGRLLILDGKNRPAIFRDSELLEDEQLSGYADAMLKKYPGQFVAPYYVGIYYFEFGYTQIVEVSEEQLRANVTRLRARAAHKESLTEDTIGPEPGFGKCQYCDYLASCPAGQELTAGGGLVVTDADQARDLAAKVLVWDEKLKAAKKALNVFTGEHGPVELDDKTRVGHAVSLDGVSYDKDATLRIIKSLIDKGVIDAKLRDFTSLNLNAVKAVAKEQAVDEALEPARGPKVDQKFEFYRPKAKRGVRVVKEGRKTVIHPEDASAQPRKTKARVKRGDRS